MINSITFQPPQTTRHKAPAAAQKTMPAHGSADTVSPSGLNLEAYIAHFQKVPNLEIAFYNAPSPSELYNKYGSFLQNNINELKTRAGKQGQVLNWIGILPKTQIARLDEIYSLAEKMKASGSEKLGIIGIGGSKHTIENLLSLYGLGENVSFLSSVNPDEIKSFTDNLKDINKAVVMTASKSGTTLEPSTGYKVVYDLFVERFKTDFLKAGLSEKEAQTKAEKETSKHFFCITDADAEKSKLRKEALEKGFECGTIHDDCGGRFGAFDDHTLTTLAYCGLPKEKMKKMLESVLKAQDKYMNPDIKKNLSAQRAMFNANAVLDGKTCESDYYFSDAFKGTLLWNTQLKKESHKSLYKSAGDILGPEFLHNCTESDLDPDNNTSFYTFNKIKNNGTENFKVHNALFDGALKAYANQHPVSVITLKDLSPESIGEYIELKHFETMYTGMLLRSLKGISTPKILPEVEQPSVKIYKQEVEKILNK